MTFMPMISACNLLTTTVCTYAHSSDDVFVSDIVMQNCVTVLFLVFLLYIGAKVQDPFCYGHTQFHVVPDRFRRDKLINKNLAEDIEVFLRANAIASLFAWTGAQAMYQGEFMTDKIKSMSYAWQLILLSCLGFWSEHDVSRPFVSQAVITDGQYFSFFCYQLNTLALSSFSIPNNSRKNLCWGTESLRLYDKVTDGDVIGWNADVFKLLVKFLMNKPWIKSWILDC